MKRDLLRPWGWGGNAMAGSTSLFHARGEVEGRGHSPDLRYADDDDVSARSAQVADIDIDIELRVASPGQSARDPRHRLRLIAPRHRVR